MRPKSAVFCILIAAAMLCAAPRPAHPAEGRLANMEYKVPSLKAGTAKLVDGEYREAAAPGSASETVVRLTDLMAAASFGGIRIAAVVLVTETGGSGKFYDLALVTEQGGSAVNVDTVSLGDRVEINSLDLVKGVVELDMLVPGPDDPACCPSKHAVRKYAITNQKLILVADKSDTGRKQQSSATLIDTLWQWRETKLEDGETLAPDDPSKYSIQLFGDGKVDARVDCNRAFGTFASSAPGLSITLSGGTTAECPPKTWGRDFVKQLHAVQSFAIKDGQLDLVLSGGRGTMRFVRGKGL